MRKSTIEFDHHFCGKINIFPVKSMFLLNSWFHGFFESDRVISCFLYTVYCTVWKNEKFFLTEKKFSSIQLFSDFFRKIIAFTKLLRNFCQKTVRENESVISTLGINLTKILKISLISRKKTRIDDKCLTISSLEDKLTKNFGLM